MDNSIEMTRHELIANRENQMAANAKFNQINATIERASLLDISIAHAIAIARRKTFKFHLNRHKFCVRCIRIAFQSFSTVWKPL